MKKLKVMVVGDDKAENNLLMAILESEGHEAICARDGIEALEKLNGYGADLVISDGRMPKLDGFALVLEIRKKEELKNIQFFLYTATYETIDREKMAFQNGVDRYIRKTGSIKVITNAIRELATS